MAPAPSQLPCSSNRCPAPHLLPTGATCPREARGALLTLLAPCSLQAETRIDTGQEGDLQPQHGHGVATVASEASHGSSPRPGAQHYARVHTSTSTEGTGMPPCPSPSVQCPDCSSPWSPTQSPPQPCTSPPSLVPSLQACLAPPCPPCPPPCLSGHARPAKRVTQGVSGDRDALRPVLRWGEQIPWGGDTRVHEVAEGEGTTRSARCGSPALLVGRGGRAVLCHLGKGLQDQTCSAGTCPGPGAGQAGPWGGGCTGEPLPIREERQHRGGPGEWGHLLPAPPCCPVLQQAPPSPQYRPACPKEEAGVSRRSRCCCPPSHCPPARGLTLSPLGPGAPTSP